MNQHSAKSCFSISDKQLTFLLAFLVAIMPFSIDGYLPALPEIANDLNTSIPRIEQSLTSFMIGVALGQLIGGSYSDIKGRKNIALIGLSIFIISTILIVFSQAAWQLLTLRFFQALGAGLATVIVAATVRDRYSGLQAAQMFATIGIITVVAPLVAPFFGAIINDYLGWRAIFILLLVYAVSLVILIKLFLPDTVKKTSLPFKVFIHTISQRYISIIKNTEALGFLFVFALSFSNMFVFLTESSFVYRNYFGLSAQQYSWAFAMNILTIAAFNRITAWKLKSSGTHKLLAFGLSVQFLSTLSIFIWTMLGNPPLWGVILFIMLSVGSQGVIAPTAQAIYLSYFSQESGTANGVSGTFLSIIAAFIGGLTTILHNGQLWPMPTMMLLCVFLSISAVILLSKKAWY